MSSILTNNGAMVALDTLRNINRNLGDVQNQISTGKSVSNAKDNAAIWAISTVMSSDVESFKQISQSLNLGSSTVGVARASAEQVTDMLKDMKKLIVSAQESNVDRTKIQTDIDALTDQIGSIVGASQFNGLNLINGSSATNVEVLSSLDRDSAGAVAASFISVERKNLSTATGGGLVALATLDVTTTAGATAALTGIETMIQTSVDAASSFGSAQKRIANQGEFVSSLVDSLTAGIGGLTDADMESASAKLQALQVQQQLGVQALSIANQAPQSLLSLFR
jgi:flagellin